MRQGRRADHRAIEATPYSRWLSNLHEALKDSQTAHRTWQMLAQAGLESLATHSLWFYAHDFQRRRDTILDETEELVSQAEATARAIRVSKARRPSRRDPALFDRRAEEHLTRLLTSKWPVTSGALLESWVQIHLQARDLPPEWVAWTLARSLREAWGARSLLHHRFFGLFLLWKHARARGVRLGAKRLASLVGCVDREGGPDARTLGRYLLCLQRKFAGSLTAAPELSWGPPAAKG